jgi:hypothetical protein
VVTGSGKDRGLAFMKAYGGGNKSALTDNQKRLTPSAGSEALPSWWLMVKQYEYFVLYV